MTLRQKVTEMQEKILRFIFRYGEDRGRAPSYREIQDGVGLKTTSAVSYQVRKLEEMALIEREKYVARSLRLTEKTLALLGKVEDMVAQAANAMTFQIAGDIGASTPLDTGNDIFSTYDEEDTVIVDGGLLPKGRDDLFAVRVRGNSMVDSLIGDRDIVILQHINEVRDGDMVAAWLRLEQELTLKHFYLEGDNVRLQPANPTMEPIYSLASNVEVQARVVSVIRQAAV